MYNFSFTLLYNLKLIFNKLLIYRLKQIFNVLMVYDFLYYYLQLNLVSINPKFM